MASLDALHKENGGNQSSLLWIPDEACSDLFSVDCIINGIKCHPTIIPVVNCIELKSLNNIYKKERRIR